MAKKSFKDNPALQFISVPSAVAEQEPDTAPEVKVKEKIIDESEIVTNNSENRSRRLNLLIQPSLHSKLKMTADRKGISLNELIHQVLEDFAK